MSRRICFTVENLEIASIEVWWFYRWSTEQFRLPPIECANGQRRSFWEIEQLDQILLKWRKNDIFPRKDAMLDGKCVRFLCQLLLATEVECSLVSPFDRATDSLSVFLSNEFPGRYCYGNYANYPEYLRTNVWRFFVFSLVDLHPVIDLDQGKREVLCSSTATCDRYFSSPFRSPYREERRRPHHHRRSPVAVRRHRSRSADRDNKDDIERLNPLPSKVLGIFGLSSQTDERNLRRLFSKFGRINNISLVYDRGVWMTAICECREYTLFFLDGSFSWFWLHLFR